MRAYHQYVWIRTRLCKLQKGCTGLTAASDAFYQLLTLGRWLSPGIPASSIAKTGRYDTAEILQKLALNKINQSIRQYCVNDEGGNRGEINNVKIRCLSITMSCQIQ